MRIYVFVIGIGCIMALLGGSLSSPRAGSLEEKQALEGYIRAVRKQLNNIPQHVQAIKRPFKLADLRMNDKPLQVWLREKPNCAENDFVNRISLRETSPAHELFFTFE